MFLQSGCPRQPGLPGKKSFLTLSNQRGKARRQEAPAHNNSLSAVFPCVSASLRLSSSFSKYEPQHHGHAEHEQEGVGLEIAGLDQAQSAARQIRSAAHEAD